MAANGAAAAVDCDYRDEHPAIKAKLENLGKEIKRVDEERRGNEKDLFTRLDGFGQRLSALEARVLILVALVGPAVTAGVLIVAKKFFGVG